MKRRTSTIPFGYSLSEDKVTLEAVPEQLEALNEIKELVHEKSLSLRDGATWLHYKTGRKLSHVGLKKIIDKAYE
tara:strand:+ start:936 stop:1160 length:225 start_codon:yes stop_codon:yes gene_type:complete